VGREEKVGDSWLGINPRDIDGSPGPVPGAVPVNLRSLEGRVRVDAGVEHGQVMLVHPVLRPLEPVAVLLVGSDNSLAPLHAEEIVPWQQRCRLGPKVRKDQAT
jgi:hypothetical protein